MRKQAEEILAKIKGGADFAELARKVSEDTSKDQGGDLDFFTRGRMVPEFETAAFAMAPGQTSDIVKSQFGFHIIRVTDKRPGSTRTLDEVRPQIQDTLQQEIADQQISTKAQELQARIKDAGDLAEAAGENGLMVQESGLFQRTDPVPGLGQAPQVANEAFTLADGAVSGALVSPRGVVFVTVAGKKDAYIPMLDEVKERVREDTIRARATELSRQRAAAVAAALKSAPDFAAAAKAQGLESKDTELIAREAPLPDIGVSTQVDKVVFALPAGGVSDPIVTDRGTVIVKVVRARRRDPGRVPHRARAVPHRVSERAPRPLLHRLHGQGEGEAERPGEGRRRQPRRHLADVTVVRLRAPGLASAWTLNREVSLGGSARAAT